MSIYMYYYLLGMPVESSLMLLHDRQGPMYNVKAKGFCGQSRADVIMTYIRSSAGRTPAHHVLIILLFQFRRYRRKAAGCPLCQE